MSDLDEPKVTLDVRQLGPVERKLRGALEEQLTSALQAATERVRDRYAGEPVEVVQQQLLAETRAGLHHDIADAWQPDPAELHRVAATIARQDTIAHHAAL
ncbi:hypothetical protein JCM9534A_21800 [Catenuloplanes indicus JCM 9534]|uniref:Uncharacterized protein n=1 Tax=Catenuloplanes indicus TaxID=137267 RepID=A0AAE3VYA8_9ACTN|nr:hypothetical protein [Catenuloplanes indicus]MDQ0365527.1 hypothetical protein [Catenuloplanes indicus]